MRAGQPGRAHAVAVEACARQAGARIVDPGVLDDPDDHAATGEPLAVGPVRPDRVVRDVHRRRPAAGCTDLADGRILGEGIDLSRRDPRVDHRREVERHDIGRALAARRREERFASLGDERGLGPDELLADRRQDLEIVADGSVAVPLDLGVGRLDRLDGGAVVDGCQDVGQERRRALALGLIDARPSGRGQAWLAPDGALDLRLVRGGVERLTGLHVDRDEGLRVALAPEHAGPEPPSTDRCDRVAVRERTDRVRSPSQDLRRLGASDVRGIPFALPAGFRATRERAGREGEDGDDRERQQAAHRLLPVGSGSSAVRRDVLLP